MTDLAPERPLVLGILSDTHGLLRPEVFTHLEGVHLILHAGDVGPPHVLTELGAIAPVLAVSGNTDGFDLRSKAPEVVEKQIGGANVVLIHGHQLGRSPTPERLHAAYPKADLIIFGHTHEPLLVKESGCTFINPGSCGPKRFHLPVGLVRGTLIQGRFDGEWRSIL
jgi:putative phosphoesterase